MPDDLNTNKFKQAVLKIDWYEENINIPDNESEMALIMAQMDPDEQTPGRDAEDEIDKLLAFEKYYFAEQQKIALL